jgi:hypothetical protein
MQGRNPESMKRAILLLHRYLGIAICLMMAAWCLSGVVMMYVGFPSFAAKQRVASLTALDFNGCCNFSAARAVAGHGATEAFEIEMLAGRPVLRLTSYGAQTLVDLRAGAPIPAVEGEEALQIGADYQRTSGTKGVPRLLGTIERDQWTVSSGYDRDRPLHKIALDDADGTELYVSAQNGEIVQRTTARERIWNYFGAVTHWLYMRPLREHAAAWAQTIIWLSVLGVFLTAAGIYLGVAQLGRSPTRWSPYRGFNLWHHLSGLVFGLFTLAWVGSGLLSMNPWGLLESRYGVDEGVRLQQIDLNAAQVIDIAERLVRAADAGQLNGGRPLLQLASAPLGNSLYLLATNSEDRLRFDSATLAAAPLTQPELLRAARGLQDGRTPVNAELLSAGDEYYYSDHELNFVPAYRVIFGDAEHSRYYFDPVTGALLSKFDRAARGYRWLFNAVHRWDFSAGIRRRPFWDLAMGVLLAGVAAGSLTGVVLGFRRVLR